MAITYVGTARSLGVFGNDSTVEYLFAVKNGIASRVNVNIRRFALQNDSILTLASLMPLVRVSRGTNISGGHELDKTPFDTTQTSDTNVTFLAPVNESARMTGTPGDTIWTQYVNRMHTAAEQQQGDDKNLLPVLVEDTGKEFVLRPGESVLVHVVALAAANNAATTTNFFTECVWEEDPVTTFAISGQVTLAAAGVSGALVTVIEADDESMTNARLVEVITTDGSGNWASTIRTGCVGAAFVQYKNGATYYTAPGSPYLE